MKRAAGSISKNHSAFVPSCPQQRNLNLCHQYVRNQGALIADWRKGHETTYCRHLIKCTIANYLSAYIQMQLKPSYDIPTALEYLLFENATSKEEYLNRETLYQRMQQILPYVLRYLSVSCGGGNLNTSSNSSSSYLPLSQANNYDMGLINQRVGLGTIQYNEKMGKTGMELLMQSHTSDLMMPQLVSSDTSEAFNDFPTWTSSVGPQDIVQYQPQKLDSQKNFTHFEQPNVFGVEPALPQSGAMFVNQIEQSVGRNQKSLDQPQLATSLANNVPFGNTESMPCAPKRRKMESGFGVPSIPSSSSDQHSYCLFQPYVSGPLLDVLQLTVSPSSEIQECNVEQFTNPMPDSMGIGDVCERAWGDIYEQIFNSVTFPSEGLEAGQTSVEPDPKSYDMIESSNLMEMDFGLNSSRPTLKNDTISTYVDDIEGRPGFNHAWPSAIKNVSELKADQEKQTKSEDARLSEIQRSEMFKSFKRHIFDDPLPSQDLEAGQISEEPVNRDCSVTDNINSKEIHIRSNSSMDAFSKNPIIIDVDDIEDRIEFKEPGRNVIEKVSEPEANQEKQTKSPSAIVNGIESNVSVDAFALSFKSKMVPPKYSYAVQISEDPERENHGVTDSSNLMEIDIESNSSMHNLNMDPILTDTEDIQGRTELNQPGTNAIEEVIEPKDDQEKQTKSSNASVDVVSLTELFTSDQIKQHIISLRKQSGQSATEEEMEISANACQLCGKEKLFFAQLPIYCLGCGNRIKQNSNYFYRKEEELNAGRCYCYKCFKRSKGGCITFTNGTSIPKRLLEQKKNDEVLEEPWVECNKCKKWQHQVCALYNNKRDLDSSVEYICPVCCLEEIENGMRVPSPETAIFHAKDLPRTTLSDHLEKRLFNRLIEEKKSYAMKNNLVEVLTAENLSVREVLTVDKILNVEKQFLDILPEKESYPAEFPYRSRVILLFQQIEGADVCIFAMYVQEYGSECGYPNRRCVYVSYLDSVKYLRPQRGTTVKNEALRTFVYHEILIGYLDFVKKRGFATCFIWACPPGKGDDYILYCHPTTQKTPKKDHLLQWYHSMLIKATEENIVVGLTNIHDYLFVPTGKWDSKVTASQLPCFDGDYWSNEAVNLVTNIGNESGGDSEKAFKKLPKRSLKDMGYDVNPPKSFVKDILVMQKLGQTILPCKEQFIVAHLQYSCMHCHEVIVSGKKRWFCTECNEVQECERCHTSGGVHTASKGVVHRLSQVTEDNVSLSTEKNNITIYNGLFEDRTHFLDFCQNNQLQFDTLRRAKYASMMILYNLKNLHTQLCPFENQESEKNTLVERDKTLTHQ